MDTARKIIIGAAIIGLVVIFVAIGLYIGWFWNFDISSVPADWSDFATYVSGMIGTLISILSLFVLGYITLMVSENSNKENKNLFYLEHRIKAYENLAAQYEEFQKVRVYSTQVAFEHRHYITKSGKGEDTSDALANLERVAKNAALYYSIADQISLFFKNFPVRYSHLFNKNVRTKDLDNLMTGFSDLLIQLHHLYYQRDEYLKSFADSGSEGQHPLSRSVSDVDMFISNYISGLKNNLK